MKKSLMKNNIKTISKSRRRFISILVMAFLGVGFYSGLVSSSPDMLDSLDKYVDKNNMYDINIISTLGLKDDDIEALQKIDGVEGVFGIHSKDTFVEFNEKENICKVIEYSDKINTPEIIAGRGIENDNECLLDARYSYAESTENYIGKKIIIKDDTDEFLQKELEVVGIVESPIYISTERGSTTLGNGSINFYIYSGNIINQDYYSEIGVKVANAEKEVTNSDKYLELVESVKTKIEGIKEERQQARYDELVNEANSKIDDAQKEYDDKKAEADRELQDAENKINEAKADIRNSEEKLDNSEKELDNQEKMLEANSQIPNIQAMKQQIANARKEIEDGRKKIQTAKQELSKNEQEFNTKKAEAQQKLDEAQQEIDDARKEVEKIEKAKWYIQDRLDNVGYTNIFDAIKTMENISKMFPVIFYLVAVLISLTSMTRMIEEERGEIGTLKALGYNNLQIISKYILYAFLACVIGGILGMSLCFYLLPSIVWTLYSMIYKIPKFYMTYRLGIGVAGILIAFICIGGATIFVAFKELKQTPSVLMRPKPPKNGKRIFMERITFIWKRLNFSKKVTIRNIFRYKKRAIITIIGIAGCTGLMLAGFGIRDSVVDIPNLQFKENFKYETSIALSKSDNIKQIEEYLNSQEKIENYEEFTASSSKAIHEKKTFDINIFVPNDKESISNIVNLKDYETGEKLEITDDGVIITDKVAITFGLKVGDTITIIDGDDVEHTLLISGITKNYVGHYMYMSKEFFEKNLDKYDTNMILINSKDMTDDEQNQISEQILNIDGVASVTNMSSMIKSVSDMLNTMNYVVVVLIVTSAMLAFVVLYNLANINIGERQREIATLKVLGFYDKEVDNYINKENIIFTILGVGLGLLFGVGLTNGIIASIEIDTLRFSKNILPTSYIWAAVITITFSIIVNNIIHFILKKIDMIESLKSVE